METHLAGFIRETPAGREAEEILRKCVHCGFCTATCPTYQLFGDELDGPRGRIYLIKQVLEGAAPSAKTQLHLDRCLTCRSCETTCPSGVHYSRLLDIGRAVVATQVPRATSEVLQRTVLKTVLPSPRLFAAALGLGRLTKPLLPAGLRAKIPAASFAGAAPSGAHGRRMIGLAGCVQPSLSPNINAAARRVLDRLGIELVEAAGAGCCGAVRFHLDDPEAARADARRNIDAWWPLLEAGAEAVVSTASGCGVQVGNYAHLLQADVAYAAKAARVAALHRDISEVLVAETALTGLLRDCPALPEEARRLAFHSPCTLQHGQGLRGGVESVLAAAGYMLTPVGDAHLCCGSAGTYSLLQAEISGKLRDNKLSALNAGEPGQIASANIGCIAHLSGGARRPVRHWVELVDERLAAGDVSGPRGAGQK